MRKHITDRDVIANKVSSVLFDTFIQNFVQPASFVLITINSVLDLFRCVTEEVYISNL